MLKLDFNLDGVDTVLTVCEFLLWPLGWDESVSPECKDQNSNNKVVLKAHKLEWVRVVPYPENNTLRTIANFTRMSFYGDFLHICSHAYINFFVMDSPQNSTENTLKI